MTPKTEYGEFTVNTRNNEYIFSPSFNAMTNIGSPSEIVDIFTILSGSVVSDAISLLATYSLNGGSNSNWLLKYLKKYISQIVIISNDCDASLLQ